MLNAVRRLGNGFNEVCDLIIRPPRAEYDPDVDLGPEVFRLGDRNRERFQRVDLHLVNMRGMTIVCSWYRPLHDRCQPCLVYLHGNCGSRRDALEVIYLLDSNVSLFCFDASGSGLSDGEYVTLGFYERQDLACVVEYLHSQPSLVDVIGLWGRSMGAVTAIMYASKDPSIRCVIGDSPFATLRLVVRDLVKRYGSRHIPRALISKIVKKIRKRIIKRAGFDIDDLDSLKYACQCVVPSFLFHGEDDTFVMPYQSQLVSEVFAGSCLHKVVEGTHNTVRGDEVRLVAIAFVELYLVDKPQAERERLAGAEEPVKMAVEAPPTGAVVPPAADAPGPSTRPAEGSVSPLDAEAERVMWSYSSRAIGPPGDPEEERLWRELQETKDRLSQLKPNPNAGVYRPPAADSWCSEGDTDGGSESTEEYDFSNYNVDDMEVAESCITASLARKSISGPLEPIEFMQPDLRPSAW